MLLIRVAALLHVPAAIAFYYLWEPGTFLVLELAMLAGGLLLFGSFEFRVGYAGRGMAGVKSSFPAIRKRTVRMVLKRV
jgi:hypothetical protein